MIHSAVHCSSALCLYLNNYFIKRIYMYIIRTDSMRGLRLCALFVVSTYISRVNSENVSKISKNGNLKIQIYGANDEA